MNSLRRRSLRLRTYDYTQAGAYCLTICAQGRACVFGNILDGTVRLSNEGEIAEECWREIPFHFPSVALDVFVVMPNHLHGIVLIAEGRDTACHAPAMERFGRPVSNSVPTIVRSFKAAVTKRINLPCNTASASIWQRNYYERVIRDEEELSRIRRYIVENPLRWTLDRENPKAVHSVSSLKRPPTRLGDDVGAFFELEPL